MPRSRAASERASGDEIDLRDLILAMWRRRLWILLATILGTGIALAYALTAPKVFESSALLIPTEPPKADQLGAASALLGKKGLGAAGDVELYQSLLTSRIVIHQLLRTPIPNGSDTGKGKFEPVSAILGVDTNDAIQLSRTISKVSRSVSVNTKQSGASGIIEVKVQAKSPWLAQAMADHLLAIGQEEIRRVRAERYNVIMGRLSQAVGQAKSEWEASARSLANYREANRSIFLPSQQLVIDRLVMERAAKEQTYLMARRDYEQQRLDREKATPPMVVLDPAQLPAQKSKPKRLAIMILGVFTSFFLACVLVAIVDSILPWLKERPAQE